MPGNFETVPPEVIASWPTPNYTDPERRTWLPLLVYILIGVSTTLMIGRFYLRVRGLAGKLGYDDFFIVIGWAASIAFASTAILSIDRYYGSVHTWDVPPDVWVASAFNAFIAQIVFIVSLIATKVSILLFYRRMTKDTYNPLWRYAIWAALGFSTALFVALMFTYFMICTPLNSYWESWDLNYNKPYKCVDGNVLSPMVGGLGILSDLYATFLPWAMLYSYDLGISRWQKFALNMMFSLSLLIAGCGGARTYYLWKMNHTYDIQWTGFDLFVWSSLECHLAVIFACTPSLRAFFRRYFEDPIKRTFRSPQPHSIASYDNQKGAHVTLQHITALPAVMNPTPALPESSALIGSRFDSTNDMEGPWTSIASAEDYDSHNMMQLRQNGYIKDSDRTQERARREASPYNLV